MVDFRGLMRAMEETPETGCGTGKMMSTSKRTSGGWPWETGRCHSNRHSRSRSRIFCLLSALLAITYVASLRGADADADDKDHNNNNDNDAYQTTLDCEMRRLFMEKAQQAVPWRFNNRDIFDALELYSRCHDTYGSHAHAPLLVLGVLHEDHTDIAAEATTDATIAAGRNAALTNQRSLALKQANRHHKTQHRHHHNNDSTLYPPAHQQQTVFYVCPRQGSDDSSWQGNRTHPFRTVRRALDATRNARESRAASTAAGGHRPLPPPRHAAALEIVLMEGVHFLSEALVLTPRDSSLILRSESTAKRAWLSGGTLLKSSGASWRPSTPPSSSSWNNKSIWVTDLVNRSHDVTGMFTVSSGCCGSTGDKHYDFERLTLARYPNADVEDWDAPNRYANLRENRDDDGDHWLFPKPHSGVPDFTFLDLMDPSNPTGHVKNDSSMVSYNQYGTGQGGACATVWGDGPSYWCSNVSAGGWAEVDQAAAKAGRMNFPAGLHVAYHNDTESFHRRVQRWKHPPRGAIFHIAHTQGWAWHQFNISHIERHRHMHQHVLREQPKPNTAATNDAKKATVIHFDKGGWQGGRNWQCTDKDGDLSNCDGSDKKLRGGPWYVEGILEELDSPGEFYWDATAKRLYLYPTAAMTETCSGEENCTPIPDLVLTDLQTLIQIQGTMEQPVTNIRLHGLGFRDAAKTYMEQWSAPSGGDWSLHRGGAVHLKGTEHVSISNCHFRRLDGNAIMLDGYVRYTHIFDNEFAWLGNGAMATWGDTQGYDATAGTQPRFNTIENNIMSNLGLYQKQSSAWGQNKACQNTIRNNVMFNLPRAAINFNDGLGGGNTVEANVIFNTCRESGDHGPINSWDRMPFLTNTTGHPSFTPLPTLTTRNLILANYGASQGFDNDDGSSWYYTDRNVYYQSDGFKMDYGGHSSRFTNNLVVGDSNRNSFYGTGSFLEGQADIFVNNTCIMTGVSQRSPVLGHLFQCEPCGMNPTNNRYHAQSNATLVCGDEELSLQDMQAKGYELGSTLQPIPPSPDQVMSWARQILAQTNGGVTNHITE